MTDVLAESVVIYQTPAWWQRALVADGTSWVWVGTFVISFTLIVILALRSLYSFYWFRRVRLLRGQGLIPSSELRVGQCAYLQLLNSREEERLRRWRTMVRRVQPEVVEVDMPLTLDGNERFAPGVRVLLAVNAVDSLYVMETEVLGTDASEPSVLKLRRQRLLHRLQRRQFARVEVFEPAMVEVVGGKSIGRYAGTVLDIGGGGMCVQAPVAVQSGSVLRLECPALSDALPESVRLTVVAASEVVVDGHLEYRLHCVFTGLDTEQLERVARYVHRKIHAANAERRWRIPQDTPSLT